MKIDMHCRMEVQNIIIVLMSFVLKQERFTMKFKYFIVLIYLSSVKLERIERAHPLPTSP